MINNNKVLVGMSGGVDSSVSAALLVEQGYEVMGITITPFKITNECRAVENERGCCSYKSTLDANDVCQKLGIPHYLVDLTKVFFDKVVEYFVDDYMHGRTPNPCVVCNRVIKWHEILKKADEYGAYYIATGHYAKVQKDELTGRFVIRKGNDTSKDQSYFLWKLTQEQLARTIFPLGNLEKSETRDIAERFNLDIAQKPDSQEVCFIPNNDYHSFLREILPDIEERAGIGNIVLNGNVIGKHRGYPFYTIGQRKGLGISYSEPLYVKNIVPETNTIEVGVDEDLLSTALIADDYNLIKYENINEPKELTVKIRYRDKGAPAICHTDDKGLLHVEFLEKRRAVTPGQSVVMYKGNDLVGGGVIKSVRS